MPRNYTRKTVAILSYTVENLQNALDGIRNDGRKIREVGKSFKIPESTVRKKLLEKDLNPPRLDRVKRICFATFKIIFWADT